MKDNFPEHEGKINSYLFFQFTQVSSFPFNPTSQCTALRLKWRCESCQTKKAIHTIKLVISSLAHTFNSSMSFMLVWGRPFHCISFLSFDIMSIAMRTLRASYTLRLMFFSSYCCCQKREWTSVIHFGFICLFSRLKKIIIVYENNHIRGLGTVARFTELGNKLIGNLGNNQTLRYSTLFSIIGYTWSNL